MWGAPGGRGCAHTWPGKVAIQADAGGQGPHALRDAARDAPEPRYHKPKTPIGRRGESLIIVADQPLRGSDLAGPAYFLINPRRQRRRALRHAYASAWLSGLLWAGRSIASMRATSGSMAPTISMCRGSMVKLSVMYSRPGQKVQILAPAWNAPQ